MLAGALAEVTVSLAPRLITLPETLLTVTVKSEPSSAKTAGGVL